MKTSLQLFTLFLGLLAPSYLFAQTYEIDPTFLTGSGFNDETIAVGMASDGDLFVAGAFASYDGTPIRGVARLNPDGSLDTGFDPGVTFDGETIMAMTVDQTNDQVYVATFSDNSVVRLNANGSVDATYSFDNTGYDGPIITMTIDANGKLLAGQGVGNLGVSARLARFDSDGAIDNTFTPGQALGQFSSGQRITNGTAINDISIDANGNIYLAGNFGSYGGVAQGFVRLNNDGTVDQSFPLDYSTIVSEEKFHTITLSNGQVLLAGRGSSGTRLERFNADASVDPYFGFIAQGFPRRTNGLLEDSSGDYILAGQYGLLKKFAGDGDDKEVMAGDGFRTIFEGTAAEIDELVVDAQGRLLVAGTFNYYNGTSQGFISRLQTCSEIEITENLSSSTNTCVGEGVSLQIAATGTNLTYQWQVKTSDSFGSTFSDITDDAVYAGSQTNTLTISGLDLSFNNYDYRCIVTGPSCSATSEWTNLNVFGGQTITTQPTDEIACEGGFVTFSMVVDGSSNDIQWQVNEGAGFVDLANGGGVSGALNSVNLTISELTAEMDGNVYRAVLATCQTPVISDEVTLTVNAAPIINEPGQQRISLCVSGDATFTVDATGTGLTYQWQYRTQPGSPIIYADLVDGGEVSGATSATLNLTGVDNAFENMYAVNPDGSSSAQFRCIVTSSDGCEANTQEVMLLQTYPTPSITLQPVSPDPLCNDGSGISTSFTAIGSAGGIQWQVNDGSGYVNVEEGGIYSGTTTNTLSITDGPSSLDGNVYRAEIGNCSSPVYSDEVNLMISDQAIITEQLTTQEVCEGGDVIFSVLAQGSNLSYQWQERLSGSVDFVDISNDETFFTSGEMLQITGASLDLDNRFYRVVVSSGENCSISSSASLQVFETPSIDTNLPDFTLCEGEAFNFSPSVTIPNFSLINFQWQEALAGSDVFADINDETKFSGFNTSQLVFLSTTASLSGNRYRLVISGCVQEVISNEATITIIGEPVISEAPIPQAVCSGDETTFAAAALGDNLTYQWFSNSGNGFQPFSNPSATGELSFNADESQNGWIFKCQIFSSAPCQSFFVETEEVALTVNSNPSVVERVTISNFPICEGEDAEAAVEISSGTPIIQWQVDDGSGFINITDGELYSGSASDVLTIIQPTAAMTGYLFRPVLSQNGCDVISQSVELNVFLQFPQPIITADESDPLSPMLSISNLPDFFSTTLDAVVEWYRDEEFIQTSLSLQLTEPGTYTAVLDEYGTEVVCRSVASDPYVFESALSVKNSQIKIYPNPTVDALRIEGVPKATYQIFGLDGKLNLTGELQDQQTIDVSQLQRGQYMLQLIEGGKVIHTGKILKIN